jgi:hypothetical protein
MEKDFKLNMRSHNFNRACERRNCIYSQGTVNTVYRSLYRKIILYCDSKVHRLFLKEASFDLRGEYFLHGQLYVPGGKVGSAKYLHILAPTGKTRNIVYK